jgi:hypothetical protein
MIRRLFISFFIIFLLVSGLSGCSRGSSSDSSVLVVEGLTDKEFQTFTVSAPEGWNLISKDQWANTIPDGTVAVFGKKLKSGFIRNLNVVKEVMNTDASSLEYAKANILLGSRALMDYRHLKSEERVIGGQNTSFHQFLARNSSTDRLHHFTQAYFMQDSVGYTVTCIAVDEGDVNGIATCEGVVMSFRLKGSN